MKFSEKWLREFINPKVETETLCHQLTMAGLEVDGIEPACDEFDGLIVAEVKSVKKHPDADKLHICEVDSGDKDLLTIVCGAPNVRAGLKTVLAKIGATLPGIPELKAATLKGVQSHGMLCAASEIGLGEDSDGILELPVDVPVGKNIKDIIGTDDSIIEISLTPNRGDCLSILGIAREVAVLNQLELKQNEIQPVPAKSESTRQVNLAADKACPRYVGRVIENVDTSVPSPLWLTEKLRRSGIRSISIVVDITNYVLLELGQPMHAFDNDLLKGDITVRFPDKDKSIKLLDEEEYLLKADTLLIADESGPLAMAGIMGGFDSAVTTQSKNIFLESAFFTPEAIIGKARQYGLHTDSSHRFERGVDPELQLLAIERATSLIVEHCGGEAGPVIEATKESALPAKKEVVLREAQIKRVLGIELDQEFVNQTFNTLQMQCKYEKNQWIITPPSHRFDIEIEVDLIEELARIYSYDSIPAAAPSAKLNMRQPDFNLNLTKVVREILVNRDYQEVITFSFVDPKLNKLLKNKNKTMLLANAIAPELSEMRTSLLPGLLNSLRYNLKRQQERIRLFETGLVFIGDEDLQQDYHIGGLIYGNIYEKQWNKDNISCSLYDIKSDVEAIMSTIAHTDEVKFEPAESEILHPGQAIDIKIGNESIGILGQLHPAIRSELDVQNDVYVFELYVKDIKPRERIKYNPISRFPSIKRDIAILVDEKIFVAEIMEQIKKEATNLLTNLQLFDLYQGEGIEKGKKSLALGLTFQATSSTLKDEEVESIMGNIIDGLHNKFGAKLRE